MPIRKLSVSYHLTNAGAMPASTVARTYVGQAHFGGTGPAGTFCRDCMHWDSLTGSQTPASAKNTGSLAARVSLRCRATRTPADILTCADMATLGQLELVLSSPVGATTLVGPGRRMSCRRLLACHVNKAELQAPIYGALGRSGACRSPGSF